MARVTVEDCTQVIPSRFELVALAAQRARIISSGGELTVDRDNDKDAVVALREIAGSTVSPDVLREVLVRNCQEKVNLDEYGVEDASSSEVENSELEAGSAEIEEEMIAMQSARGGDSDDELLYGEDNLEEVDD